MGADLIGYHLVGPVKISPRKQKEIAANFKRWRGLVLESIKKGLELPVEKLKAEDKVRLKEVNEILDDQGLPPVERLSAPDPDLYADRWVEILGACGFERETTDEQVAEFINFWNAPCERDASDREVKYKSRTPFKVVFAGELSWGDEPSGEGYRILKEACRSGIARMAGCV
jgi:hypothetical protein